MHNIHTYHISISTYGFILYLTRPFPTLAFLFSGTNLVWSIISTSPIRTLAPDFRRKCLQVFWRTWDMFVLKMFWKLPKVERVTRIHETKASQVWQLLLCLVQDAVPWEHQAPIPTPEQMWSIETSTSRTASSAQFRALHGPSRFSRKGPLDFVFSMVVCVVSYSTFNSLGMLGSWITIRPSLADTSSRCFVLLWGPTVLWTFVDGQFAWNRLHLLLCRECVKTALLSIHSFWHQLAAPGAPPYGRCGLCLDCLVRVVRMGEFFSSVNSRTGKSLHQRLTRNVAWKNTTTALRVGFILSVEKGGLEFFTAPGEYTLSIGRCVMGILMEMFWDGII